MSEEEWHALDAWLHERWKAAHPSERRPAFFPIRLDEEFYVAAYVT